MKRKAWRITLVEPFPATEMVGNVRGDDKRFVGRAPDNKSVVAVVETSKDEIWISELVARRKHTREEGWFHNGDAPEGTPEADIYINDEAGWFEPD